jgi:hypothetical protein
LDGIVAMEERSENPVGKTAGLKYGLKELGQSSGNNGEKESRMRVSAQKNAVIRASQLTEKLAI